MRPLFRATLLGLALAAAGLRAFPARADSAVLAKNGTLYEVFPTTYGELVPNAGPDAPMPVLGLRTTPSDGPPTVELIDGTVDPNQEWGEAIEYDETTQTVFVVYTKSQGMMADVHVAIRRGRGWVQGSFFPGGGLYLSLNARLVVTRQHYIDWDSDGGKVTKWRSILNICWWEEVNGVSEARYAAVFVEDDDLKFDDVIPYSLNQLAGAAGPTDARDLPLSSYLYPAIQRDTTSNGGVMVSFANLATRRQNVLGIQFPDDLTILPGSSPDTPKMTPAMRGHSPVGRTPLDTDLPVKIDASFLTAIGTVISPQGVPTFYWPEGPRLRVLRGNAVADPPLAIPLRPDFSIDRAISVVRDMAEKE